MLDRLLIQIFCIVISVEDEACSIVKWLPYVMIIGLLYFIHAFAYIRFVCWSVSMVTDFEIHLVRASPNPVEIATARPL